MSATFSAFKVAANISKDSLKACFKGKRLVQRVANQDFKKRVDLTWSGSSEIFTWIEKYWSTGGGHGILPFMDVQKLYGPEISQFLLCMPQFCDNLWWLFIFSNYIGEIDHLTLGLLKKSDT